MATDFFNNPVGGTVDQGSPAGTSSSVFGEDLLFTDDLQLATRGDYQTVVGVENLRRAVWRRLIVRLGEYKLNPQYGVGILDFVKKKITTSTLHEIRHRINDNLSQERRITQILEVTVTETLFGTLPGLTVLIRVQALGNEIRFSPFLFKR